MGQAPTVTTSSRPTLSDGASSNQSQQPEVVAWKPSYVRKVPLLGLACLAGVVLCSAAAVAVLVASNHMSSTKWHQNIAPNVCLSLINSVSNILLALAISYGVAIAWWRKAMHGATVAELHESWKATSSFRGVIGIVGSFNAVALAALAAKVAIADGVLFQRATCTYVHHDPPTAISSMGIASTEWPSTGYVVSNASYGGQASCGCFMIGDQYSPVVNTWETSNGFFRGYNDWFRSEGNPTQHCDGTCWTHIEAIGFEIDCEEDVLHRDIAAAPIAAWEAVHNGTNNSANLNASAWTDVQIFNSSFSLTYNDPTTNYTYLNLDLLRFVSDNPYNPSSRTCAGNVYTTSCKLRPALITYPVEVMNYSNPHIINGVSLNTQPADFMDPWQVANDASDADAQFKITGIPPQPYSRTTKQAQGVTVNRYLDVHDTHSVGSTSALGGLASAINHFLSSTATITYHGEAGADSVWSLKQVGTLSQRMMFGPPNMGSCDCSFLPQALDTIVESVNQLTFLTAIGMIQQDDFEGQTVSPGFAASTWEVERNATVAFRELSPAVQISDVVYYMTNFEYMVAGVITTLVAVMLVIPSYWRYGQLGRDVTLGPIEVASAFQAPLLTRGRRYRKKDTGDVEDLIKEVGDRKVMYGFVDEHVPSADGGGAVVGDSDSDGGAGTGTGGTAPRPAAVQRTSVYMGPPERVRPASGVYSPPTSPGVGSPRVVSTRAIVEGDEKV
ncbi:uncharacterized protein HMPREF1541_10484 [Cyphellophora europaea CBS 101466]|uniref:Uncharacterized protein n=1 Tax=Cyphellophora europaea (strain CBS 101466) TaxID=1220924 RepID=W2S8P9_CYPE1|nr:uncharacterized protein HMPREF1541_10484 [Cyphellophora europaea CBS 101466]ETN44304.1 hypothetical protein HMPREF1541_10484 [Cyphellophora europaea CBS 101466]